MMDKSTLEAVGLFISMGGLRRRMEGDLCDTYIRAISVVGLCVRVAALEFFGPRRVN